MLNVLWVLQVIKIELHQTHYKPILRTLLLKTQAFVPSLRFAFFQPTLNPVWPDWAILTGFGDKVSYKSSPNNRQLLGLLIKYIFSITAVATFLNTLWEKIGLLFTSPSGHTDCIHKIFELLKAIHHSVKLFEEENGLVS